MGGKTVSNPVRACWIGNPRYTNPLNPTDDKKWRLLSSAGIDACVIAFAASARPRQFMQHAHFYLLPNLPFSWLRYAEMFLFSPFMLLWLIFHHHVQVIIAQSPYEGAFGAVAKNVARIWRKPVALVIENHGDFEVVLFQQRNVLLKGLYRRVMGIAARYAFRHADLLRAISSVTERQLHTFAPNLPIHHFMTWTDSTIFRETPREKPLIETHDILYAGVLTPLKGVHFLIEAFAPVAREFPDASLWLVGKPENRGYAAQLEQQVQQSGLQNRVRFTGAASQQDLARYMGQVRVLVLPSTTEGLGRVLVEAMLCGTPVIGSRVGGIPDVIQDGVNGYLIPPGDVATLTTRLSEALHDPQIEAMGQRARAFAEQFFSEDAYVEGYRNLLNAAAALLPERTS